MGQFYDRKRKGLCTKCGVNRATGIRLILCDVCRGNLSKEHAKEAEPTRYYSPDGMPQTNGSRG